MGVRLGLALVPLALLVLLAPTGISGQLPPSQVTGGVGWETYRFSDAEAVGLGSVSLVTAPFSAGADLHPSVRLRIRGAYAAARIERADGTTASIRGPVDTELQVEARVGPDRLRVAGVVQLPTGHSGYSLAEAEAAGVIAADVLPFRITNWGTGGAAGVHTSLAGRVSDVGVGASASYLVGRKFDVFAGEEFAYRPGNQLSLGAAVDRNVGRAGKAALQLQMTRYGDDELGGSNLYRSGNRVQVTGSYAFAAPRFSTALVYAGTIHRSRGTFLETPQSVASQNLLMTGAVMRMPVSWGVVVPTVDLRALRSGDGTDQGYTASVGGSLERAVGSLTLIPMVRARFGRVVVFEGARSAFSGVDLGLSTRFGGSGA